MHIIHLKSASIIAYLIVPNKVLVLEEIYLNWSLISPSGTEHVNVAWWYSFYALYNELPLVLTLPDDLEPII